VGILKKSRYGLVVEVRSRKDLNRRGGVKRRGEEQEQRTEGVVVPLWV
jgi:hypothetical protein